LQFDVLEARELPAAFTPGNVVVYRVGTGSAPLTNAATEVFLDEFNSTTGELVQSVAMPTADSGLHQTFTQSGVAASAGLLTRSADGKFLLAGGYDAPVGTASVATTTSAAIARVAAVVGMDASIDTTTALTNAFSGDNFRAVASANGTDLWLSGSAGSGQSATAGVQYATRGSTTAIQISGTAAGGSTLTNIRQVHVFNGQLYISTASGTAVRLGAVGDGLPTTGGQEIAPLPGYPSSSGAPYGFFFADLDATVSGLDTLYVADESATALAKFSLVGGLWTQNGAVGVDTDDYRGVTGVVSGSTVTLYAIRKGGSAGPGGGELVKIVDATGYNATITATPTVLATATAQTAFRGVALTPEQENVGPTNALPGSFNVTEDTDAFLAGISVADPDAGTATIQVTFSIPAGAGTLIVKTDVAGGVSAAQVANNGTAAVVVSAPIAAINATLADASGLHFAPAANVNGNVILTMHSSDLGNTGGGGARTDTDQSTIAIAAVNDAPSNIAPTLVATNEDAPLAFSGADTVAVDDVDANVGALRVVLSATNGTATLANTSGLTITGNGTALVTAVGTLAALNAGLATLSFTPAANFFGTATLAIATDDQGNSGAGGAGSDTDTVTIAVNPVNDPPVLGDYRFIIAADAANGSSIGQVSATDVENDTIAYAITAGNADGRFAIDSAGAIALVDNTGLSGAYVLEVTATDNGTPGKSDTGEITIVVNTAPTSNGIDDHETDEDAGGPIEINLGAGFDDAEETDEDLTYTVESNSNPALFASIDVVGTTLTIALAANAFGMSDLIVRAADSLNQYAEADFTITVRAVNDAPTLDPIGSIEIDEDSPEQAIELTGIAVGPANEAGSQAIESILAVSDNPNMIPNPTVTFANGKYTLRFTPVANAAGTAEISVTVTDNGGTNRGGVNAITRSFNVTVQPLPDAPIIDTAPVPMFPAIALRSLPAGTSIAQLAANVIDFDAGDPRGIAVTAIDNSRGQWQYNLNGAGDGWQPIPAVSDAAALLLADDADTLLRFVPSPRFTGFASIRYKAWDKSNNKLEGAIADSSAQGDTAYSTATEWAWAAVGKTKPAVDSFGRTILPAVREDARQSKIVLVRNVLGIAGLETAKPNLGVAITSVAGSGGTWQYRLAKTKTWLEVGPVSTTSALLLSPADQLRFVPAVNDDGAGRIAFQTWDQSVGSRGERFNPVGGAFGVNPGRATVEITPVNDAPVLDLSVPALLDPIEAGETTNDVEFASIMSATDAEGASVGVAITATRGPGAWTYSTDGGTSWSLVGPVSGGKPLLLNATDRVRFTAAFDATTGSASLSFRAWDRTTGVPRTRGKATLLSREIERLTVAVANQPPVLADGDPTLPSVSSAAARPGTGAPVRTLLGSAISDTPRSMRGIAVTGLDNANGVWQYSLGGNKWVNIGTATPAAAVLLADSSRIRFVPFAGLAGTATIRYKAWDRSAGQPGDLGVDTTGLLNSFSAFEETATITVTSA
jgi:hypothetical protein